MALWYLETTSYKKKHKSDTVQNICAVKKPFWCYKKKQLKQAVKTVIYYIRLSIYSFVTLCNTIEYNICNKHFSC